MSTNRHLPPEALDEWLQAAAAELGLDSGTVSIRIILDVARDIAHNVARPAAPLSTFLLGLAVARAGQDADSAEVLELLDAKAADLTELALAWPSSTNSPASPASGA